MTKLTPTMQRLLVEAFYRPQADIWQVLGPGGGGPARALAALKTRGLVTWHSDPSGCGWALTRAGMTARQAALIAGVTTL